MTKIAIKRVTKEKKAVSKESKARKRISVIGTG
jgi:hypothetical protein